VHERESRVESQGRDNCNLEPFGPRL
jgi:hypothetical protein